MIHFNWLGDVNRYNMSFVPQVGTYILINNEKFKVVNLVYDLDSLSQDLMNVYFDLGISEEATKSIKVYLRPAGDGSYDVVATEEL
jgi:hypothetical protein